MTYTVRQLAEDERNGLPHKFSDFPTIYTGDSYDDAVVAAYLAAQKLCFVEFAIFVDGVFEESYEDISCSVTLSEAEIRQLLRGEQLPYDFDPVTLSGIEDEDAASFALNNIPYPNYDNERFGLGFAS